MRNKVDSTNREVAVLLVVFIAFSIISTLSILEDFGGRYPSITGLVTTGDVNLSVQNTTRVNFTTANVTWGGGNVDGAKTRASVNTVGQVIDGNWTALNKGFVIENTGNVNVTLKIKGIKTAALFIGGTNPGYRFNVSRKEAGSCQDGITNYSDWVDMRTTDLTVCYNFTYLDTKDELYIGINLTIPEDSKTGNLNDTIIATATDCSC